MVAGRLEPVCRRIANENGYYMRKRVKSSALSKVSIKSKEGQDKKKRHSMSRMTLSAMKNAWNVCTPHILRRRGKRVERVCTPTTGK